MTHAGVILGTAAYMSPEQARGRPVDKRADIWAFGVVLYEMLAGRSAFHGETVTDTLAAVLRADIDLSLLPRETPARLRRLLERCLERDPRQRLRDIGDARIELEQLATRGGEDAPREAIALIEMRIGSRKPSRFRAAHLRAKRFGAQPPRGLPTIAHALVGTRERRLEPAVRLRQMEFLDLRDLAGFGRILPSVHHPSTEFGPVECLNCSH